MFNVLSRRKIATLSERKLAMTQKEEIATLAKRCLLRNFTASKGFVGGMYLIPLFVKRG